MKATRREFLVLGTAAVTAAATAITPRPDIDPDSTFEVDARRGYQNVSWPASARMSVYLDGQKVGYCLAADSKRGAVIVVKTGKEGRAAIIFGRSCDCAPGLHERHREYCVPYKLKRGRVHIEKASV